MRALLDTNVIIHRENTKATSFTIGKLFYWLDKLRYEKLIHPYSIAELRKYRNPQMQSLYDAKIDAYTEMVVKFIFIKSLTKRITLGELWSSGIIPQYSGPRPFDHISDADFDTILAKSQTKIHFERQ